MKKRMGIVIAVFSGAVLSLAMANFSFVPPEIEEKLGGRGKMSQSKMTMYCDQSGNVDKSRDQATRPKNLVRCYEYFGVEKRRYVALLEPEANGALRATIGFYFEGNKLVSKHPSGARGASGAAPAPTAQKEDCSTNNPNMATCMQKHRAAAEAERGRQIAEESRPSTPADAVQDAAQKLKSLLPLGK